MLSHLQIQQKGLTLWQASSSWAVDHSNIIVCTIEIEVGLVRYMEEVVNVTREVVKATEMELNVEWFFLDQRL